MRQGEPGIGPHPSVKSKRFSGEALHHLCGRALTTTCELARAIPDKSLKYT